MTISGIYFPASFRAEFHVSSGCDPSSATYGI